HVVVTALTHGNEICGAIALDRLFRAEVRPRRGRLSLAFNNVAAYHEFDPRYPIASRYVDEDFNRLWSPATLDGPRQSMELARARRLRPLIDSANLLLDLHSMQYATAPLMLAGLLLRSRDLALRIGHDGEREVRTPYDNCILIMPSRRLVRGQTAVRLGRYVD